MSRIPIFWLQWAQRQMEKNMPAVWSQLEARIWDLDKDIYLHFLTNLKSTSKEVCIYVDYYKIFQHQRYIYGYNMWEENRQESFKLFKSFVANYATKGTMLLPQNLVSTNNFLNSWFLVSPFLENTYRERNTTLSKQSLK